MSRELLERAFEDAIERALLAGGPDGVSDAGTAIEEVERPPYDAVPGGYYKRRSEEFDRALCLIPRDVLDFVQATQPKEWQRLQRHHGPAVGEQFLKRLASEIDRRGALDVLRHGIKDSGCKFNLAYFRPASGLNEETRRLYLANLFSVIRQLRYGEGHGKTLDLALFLNGIPLFTAEVKNPFTGQTVEDAIRQYKTDRDPRDPLLSYRRCLGHFAVDPELVYITTHLDGAKTVFLPFNRGRFGGAGNPPAPPTTHGYATSYLWEEIWARDSVLDLIRQFIHDFDETDEDGRPTGKSFLVFPRHHQLEAVRKLVSDARRQGPGRRYLIQHSAGSGKSFTIAWLAHRLATLHDTGDRRVFDSIVVVTDRRVLDRQLQNSMRQFEQALGVVENIDTTARQLKDALESGKTIIVTTLQKFPVIVDQMGALPGKRFAVIVDEAHSSQTGESVRSLKAVLAARTLEEAEKEEADAESPEDELERMLLERMAKQGRLPNVSMFAFTATPKQKTLELFGTKRADGRFEAFHLYSMRQAIEEGFILDVLQNYVTYQTYWRLLKKIEDDPRYDKKKAEYLLKLFVELNPQAVDEKVKIIVEHFAGQTQHQIGRKAKAMVVTRSRLHAVRYKRAIDRYLAERGHPWKALVAFSGTVEDGGQAYTESGMNGLPESQTAKSFARLEYRFLIAANKFQTGFDQPLLHTMYVDKQLGGVNAVQTLSRLNRVHPDKHGTIVLDFVNTADEIVAGFKDYYETTLLSEATDPNLLYELHGRLAGFPAYTEADVRAFATLYCDAKTKQDRLYAALAPVIQRFQEMRGEQKYDFRGHLTDYVRLYAFLSQILTFTDADLERLYVFARHLRRLLPTDYDSLPREIQSNIEIESYRVEQTFSGSLRQGGRAGMLEPIRTKDQHAPGAEEMEPLSRIIAELNERFGLDLGPRHGVTISQMMERLDTDRALDAAAQVNPRENVRLTFDQKVEQIIQEIVDSNFELYKRITDDRAFGEVIKNLLFDQYLRTHRRAEDLIKQGESKTLEFKGTLRFSLKENRHDDRGVTLAVLKTIAAFLNTEGGDLLIGVTDNRSVIGIDADGFDSEDRFMLHLAQAVRNALGERAGTCIDPRIQVVDGKAVCLVACRRSPEPVFLKWKGLEQAPEGDFYVRSGPGSVRLSPESGQEYIRTRFQSSTLVGKPVARPPA